MLQEVRVESLGFVLFSTVSSGDQTVSPTQEAFRKGEGKRTMVRSNLMFSFFLLKKPTCVRIALRSAE